MNSVVAEKPRDAPYFAKKSPAVHCKKYPHIHRCFVASFPYLTEPVPPTFVSVNRRNNEARVHIAMWAQASLFRRFTDTNVTD